jgi:hypothetical protein
MSGILEQMPEPLLRRRESLLDGDPPGQCISHRGTGWRTASSQAFDPSTEGFIAQGNIPGGL